jgi:hypothetical protein
MEDPYSDALLEEDAAIIGEPSSDEEDSGDITPSGVTGAVVAASKRAVYRMKDITDTKEYQRLVDSSNRDADWKNWGPYVSERAWGTVREDYSTDGSAWTFFPHEHARSRAYRWNEDGLAGVCNRFQNVVITCALWNEKDDILKVRLVDDSVPVVRPQFACVFQERLFGLNGIEGNHGEDVKEYYFYQVRMRVILVDGWSPTALEDVCTGIS